MSGGRRGVIQWMEGGTVGLWFGGDSRARGRRGWLWDRWRLGTTQIDDFAAGVGASGRLGTIGWWML